MQRRCILITGGGRRIGAETARELHALGFDIAVHYRHSAAGALALVDELNRLRGESAQAFAADLNRVETFPALIEAVVARFGGLYGLVNNASSFFPTPLGQIGLAEWDDLVGSNLRAPLFLAQAAAPHLQASGGCIVNITDVHAERPLKGFPVYNAAKGGLLNLTRSLAIELAPKVRVNAVAPGAIAWPEDDTFPDTERAAIVEHTLLKRIGAPSDIARTVRFLIADAPYITGQVINVDGGRTAHL